MAHTNDFPHRPKNSLKGGSKQILTGRVDKKKSEMTIGSRRIESSQKNEIGQAVAGGYGKKAFTNLSGLPAMKTLSKVNTMCGT